ncbi:MAG TPA: dihydroneopterin aldolase [Stellaceae bacterium]|jgi:dihydroneopterin aldolase|nr:dihydroneopterin aldolase [Stellaceae bacterium]
MSTRWPESAPQTRAADESAVGYRVFVRDLVLPCSIGIYPREKGLRRRVRVNAELQVELSLPSTDDFADVVNYETIVSGIKAITEGGHINLVETLADRIATLCMADRRVVAVRVMVEKLDVWPETESVGVVVERKRP